MQMTAETLVALLGSPKVGREQPARRQERRQSGGETRAEDSRKRGRKRWLGDAHPPAGAEQVEGPWRSSTA